MSGTFSLDDAYGAPPAPPAAPQGKPGAFTLDDAYGAAKTPAKQPPATTKPDPITAGLEPYNAFKATVGGVRAGAHAAMAEVAGVGDMILDSLTSIVPTTVNLGKSWLSQAIDGDNSKARAVAIRKEFTDLQEATSPHAFSRLVGAMGLAPEGAEIDRPLAERAIGKVLEWSDNDMREMEHRSGGKVKAENLMSLRDWAINFVGAKAAFRGGAAVVERAGKPGPIGDQSFNPADQIPDGRPTAPTPVPPGAAEIAARDAAAEAAVARLVGETAEKVRRSNDPKLALQALQEKTPYLADKVKDALGGMRGMPEGPTIPTARTVEAAPRTGSRDAVLLDPEGRPLEPPAVMSAADKLREGKGFDLSAEEKVALNDMTGSRKAGLLDQYGKALATAGVVTSGAMLADWLGGDSEDEQLASKATAGMLGVAALSRLRPNTPLGAIVDQSPYTLKTFARLPQNKWQFTREQVMQQVQRADVTKAERDVILAALGERETITAQELAGGVKMATGDFELKPKVVQDFAAYGLDAIGRVTEGERFHADEGLTTIERAGPQDARTTIYQSPIKLGDANHFSDPNYFAHTRSFDEGGVRHVVELQSDLAQKAGRGRTPEERAALETDLAAQQKIYNDAVVESTKLHDGNIESKSGEAYVATRLKMADARAKIAEIKAKLGETAADPVRPMLRDWWKRLVREEVAAAARAGVEGEAPGVIRFATADTVAKVEGWPRDTAESLAADRENLRRLQGFDPNNGHPITERAAQSMAEAEARVANGNGFRPEHASIFDRYRTDVEKFLRKDLGAREHTDSAGHTWLEVDLPEARGGRLPPTQMFGGIDPKTSAYLAAVGTSAALAYALTDGADDGGKERNRLRNAALAATATALGGLAVLRKSSSRALSDAATGILRTAEDMAGNLSYQLEKVSPPLLRSLRNFERGVLTSTHDRLQRISGFVNDLRGLSSAENARLDAALLRGDWQAALESVPEGAKRNAFSHGLAEVRDLLESMRRDAVDNGLMKKGVENYFPRRVADYEGLIRFMGHEPASYLEKRLAAAEASAAKKTGQALGPSERAAVVNEVVNEIVRGKTGTGKPTFMKGRSIEEVTAEMSRFYEPPAESLIAYVRATTKAVERAKFFGKNIVKDEATGKVNLEASIGNTLAPELAAGKIDRAGFEEATRLLKIRFGPGEEAAGRIGRAVSGATTVALLSNPLSAMMNLQDVATVAAVQGMLPAAKAVASILTKKPQRYTTADVGLASIIGEEFVGGASSPVSVYGRRLSMARFVDKMMRASGFQAADLFGKSVGLNGAIEGARAKLRSVKGIEAFDRRQAEYFGDELQALKEDLRSGKKSDLVLEYAFRELSDMQPVSKSEMPTMYLNNPNARLAWQMKSYMIKQLTMIRNKGIDQILAGNVREGSAFLARYGLLVGAAGAGMDFIIKSILGRDDELEWKDIPMQAMKNFGISEYLLDAAKKGDVKAALGNVAIPASVNTLFDVYKKPDEIFKYMPLVGKVLYNWTGGAEEANEKARKRREREERKEAS